VRFGPRPADTLTLADLGRPDRHAELVALLTPVAGGKGRAALTVTHISVAIVVSTLVAPLVVDGVELMASAADLGAVIDDDGDVRSYWIGAASTTRSPAPRRVGATSMRLISPVVDLSRRSGRIGARGVQTIALDALVAGTLRLARMTSHPAARQRADELLRGAGRSISGDTPTITVAPDDGPPVVLPVPTICCVLSRTATRHACPTCPLHPENERERILVEFLGSLDDEGFRYATGRHRIEQYVRSTGTPRHDPATLGLERRPNGREEGTES
jgi:hypothetical protein